MKSPYPCDDPKLRASDPEIILDAAAATFRLQGVPFSTTTNPEVGKLYDLDGDGVVWLCTMVSPSRAVLHPVGVPSKTVSVSAKAELREVRK